MPGYLLAAPVCTRLSCTRTSTEGLTSTFLPRACTRMPPCHPDAHRMRARQAFAWGGVVGLKSRMKYPTERRSSSQKGGLVADPAGEPLQPFFGPSTGYLNWVLQWASCLPWLALRLKGPPDFSPVIFVGSPPNFPGTNFQLSRVSRFPVALAGHGRSRMEYPTERRSSSQKGSLVADPAGEALQSFGPSTGLQISQIPIS